MSRRHAIDTGRRGYFGIGVERGKTPANLGTLWRSAVNLGASYIFTIGGRYHHQPTDTVKSHRLIPLISFDTVEQWRDHLPMGCVPVGIELTDDAVGLTSWVHPEQACYLLGPEDGSLSRKAVDACAQIVSIPSTWCLNQAVAGSIVMYDRNAKADRLRRGAA